MTSSNETIENLSNPNPDILKELLRTEIELMKSHTLFMFGIAAGIYNILGKTIIVLDVDVSNQILSFGGFLLLIFGNLFTL